LPLSSSTSSPSLERSNAANFIRSAISWFRSRFHVFTASDDNLSRFLSSQLLSSLRRQGFL
jgi:hypothetical protein